MARRSGRCAGSACRGTTAGNRRRSSTTQPAPRHTPAPSPRWPSPLTPPAAIPATLHPRWAAQVHSFALPDGSGTSGWLTAFAVNERGVLLPCWRPATMPSTTPSPRCSASCAPTWCGTAPMRPVGRQARCRPGQARRRRSGRRRRPRRSGAACAPLPDRRPGGLRGLVERPTSERGRLSAGEQPAGERGRDRSPMASGRRLPTGNGSARRVSRGSSAAGTRRRRRAEHDAEGGQRAAVAAVMARRVCSGRPRGGEGPGRSPAASPRISPTDMARMASARAAPTRGRRPIPGWRACPGRRGFGRVSPALRRESRAPRRSARR